MSDNNGIQTIIELLKNIPNSVDGDGKRFAAAIKKVLSMYGLSTERQIEDMKPGSGTEQVTGVTLLEMNTTDGNGMPKNNIEVSFSSSAVTDYASAQIWITQGSVDNIDDFRQVGTTNGLKYVVENVSAGTMYFVKVVAVNSSGGSSSFEEAPQASIEIRGSALVPTVPRQFVLTWDEEGPLWEWLHEDNGYVDFFELRLDGNAGVYGDKLLDRTRDFKSRANPKTRSGTAYLFVRNIFGTYSQPAVHQFGKPLGSKPLPPVLSPLLSGVNIKMEPMLEGYASYKLIINDDNFTSKNNEFVYFIFSGKITVKYCFVDDIGDGEYSEEVTADVKQLISAGDIADGAVGETQIAANAVTAGKIQANAVTADKIEAGAITADKIHSDAITADKIEAGAITATKIHSGSIIGDHISAGAVTTEKLAAANIDLLGALAIVGGAVRLDENGLICAMANGDYTLFDERGITYIDSAGNSYAQTWRMCIGTAKHGQTVSFSKPWDSTPSVLCLPSTMQVNEANYAQSNVFLVCNAYDVNKEGFKVNCYTKLGAGSSTTGAGFSVSESAFSVYPTGSGDTDYVYERDLSAPSGSTSINAVFNFSMVIPTHHGGDTDWSSYRHYLYLYMYLIVNDEVVQSKSENPWQYGGFTHTTMWTASANYAAGSKVKVKVYTYYRVQHVSYGHSIGRTIFSVNPISYTADNEMVISTGVATFIAVKNADFGYSVSE
jgi:hypothetical protein|nr:MAG TPA: H-type lectin domain [Caudoviricetes sp.]